MQSTYKLMCALPYHFALCMLCPCIWTMVMPSVSPLALCMLYTFCLPHELEMGLRL